MCWYLREQVTRNHQCGTISELTELTLAWIEQHDRGRFKIEGAMEEALRQSLKVHKLAPTRLTPNCNTCILADCRENLTTLFQIIKFAYLEKVRAFAAAELNLMVPLRTRDYELAGSSINHH